MAVVRTPVAQDDGGNNIDDQADHGNDNGLD